MRSLLIAASLVAGSGAASAASPLDLDEAIVFGASVQAMSPVFDRLCGTHEALSLDPAELPIAQDSHVQVNCQNFQHAGAARLAEFVFADDQLAFIWVLTDASEEAVHLQTMQARYGTPSHDTPMFVAFAENRTALRRDIPEFLYYSEAIAPMYQAWFDQMAAQQ